MHGLGEVYSNLVSLESYNRVERDELMNFMYCGTVAHWQRNQIQDGFELHALEHRRPLLYKWIVAGSSALKISLRLIARCPRCINDCTSGLQTPSSFPIP